MTDYILKFPSKSAAEQFGIASGFASANEDGEVQSNLASHTHAMCVVGEHWIPQLDIDGEPQPSISDGQWWVLFRDLVGIPIPEGADQFIYWASDFTVDDEDGNPVPVPRPISDDVPNIWWA
jgi:hypothetical protein